MSKLKLLIVDDEPFNLDILQAFLEEIDAEIDATTDPEKAWEMARTAFPSYNAIILDYMMPVLDGISLLKRIKADPGLAHIPVIMQTASSEPETVNAGLQAGAYYYLIKPYEQKTLLAIVRASLDDVRQRNQLIQRAVRQESAWKLVEGAHFSFRTLNEAQDLAILLSVVCPNPQIVVTGLSELLINAVEHGNLGLTYQEKNFLKRENRWENELNLRLSNPAYANRRATVSLQREMGKISFRIADQGSGFDWRPYLELSPERAADPNGRGIALARMLSFTSLKFEGTGNVVLAQVVSK